MSSSDKLDCRDRLILIQVKVEGAKKHLRNLASDVAALSHVTILTPDPNTGVPPHPISLMHPNNFETVPTLPFNVVATAGDIIHNLRTALDHLAYHLVAVGIECASLATPLSEVEMRQIEFPIAETFKKYEDSKRKRVKGMLQEAIDAIDRLKPYKGGNDVLWRIHELDNIDKHRTLLTLAPNFLFTGDWFTGAYLVKAQNPVFAGVVTQEEKDVQLEIEQAIGQSQVTNTNALLPSLHQLVDFVENVVISFRPLLRNIYERSVQ